jgi:hypothetical protein
LFGRRAEERARVQGEKDAFATAQQAARASAPVKRVAEPVQRAPTKFQVSFLSHKQRQQQHQQHCLLPKRERRRWACDFVCGKRSLVKTGLGRTKTKTKFVTTDIESLRLG